MSRLHDQKRVSPESKTQPKSKSKSRWRRVVVCGLVVLFAGLVVSWVVGSFRCAPARRVVNAPDDLPIEAVTLSSSTGAAIETWMLRNSGPGVVLLVHPLRGCRLSMLSRARLLWDAGYSLVMIDLQAHGESDGEQITFGHLEQHDVYAALEYIQQEFSGETIGVIGVSLGGASTLLAHHPAMDAVVLESVFPAIDRAVHNRVVARLGPLADLPASLLLAQLGLRQGISAKDIRPIDFVAELNCPVFVISGEQDVHTTAEETKQLFEAANEPRELWIVPEAAHEDLLDVAPDEYQRRVLSFLDRHLRSE